MATFRKRRSRRYKRRNTRKNIRRNTRRKYIKARKSSINRHSRKSLEGGLFFTRRSAAVAPAPYDRPQIGSLSISGESNNIGSLLPHEDKTSSIQLDAAKRMDMDMGIQLMKQKKTAEERKNEAAAFAESLQNLSEEDKKQFAAIEKLRIPL
jgi:hypothetical protein